MWCQVRWGDWHSIQDAWIAKKGCFTSSCCSVCLNTVWLDVRERYSPIHRPTHVQSQSPGPHFRSFSSVRKFTRNTYPNMTRPISSYLFTYLCLSTDIHWKVPTVELELDFAQYIHHTDAQIVDLCWSRIHILPDNVISVTQGEYHLSQNPY